MPFLTQAVFFSYFLHIQVDNLQQGELQHKLAKCRYAWMNKHNYVLQLARHDACKRFLVKIDQELKRQQKQVQVNTCQHRKHKARLSLPYIDPLDQYHISASTRDVTSLSAWLWDLATESGLQVSFYFYGYYFSNTRPSRNAQSIIAYKTIFFPGCLERHTMVTSCVSRTKNVCQSSSYPSASGSTRYCTRITWRTTSDASKTW